jgi:hypothetical protein
MFMVIPTHRHHYERDNVRHDAMSLRAAMGYTQLQFYMESSTA